MFFLYTTTLCIYLLFRTVLFLSIPIYAKIILGIFIILGTNFHFISKQISGMLVADYPKLILYVWEFLFAFCVVLFLITLLLDIVRVISLLPFLKTINVLLISNNTTFISLGLSFILAIYGLYQGNRVPDIKVQNIYIENWPKELNGFKVIQLTDLHVSNLLTKKWLNKVVNKSNEENPDLIVITGDLTDGYPENYKNNLSPLKNLKAKYGVFGSQGNHEYYFDFNGWNKEYKLNNVEMLNNSHVLIDNKFILAGVTDPVAKQFGLEPPDIEKALLNTNKDLPIILLDHRPTNVEINEKNGVDLQLSGHTHGGMMPLLAQVVKKMNKGFNSGYYQIGKLQLYLSNGTGIWNGFPIRLGYNSEITLIKIYRK